MNPHTRQRARAWLGAGLILLIVALAAFVFMLDPLLARLRPTYTLVVVLPTAPQLAPGSRVWVSGRDVGRVTEVGFMPSVGDTTSRIVMTLELPVEVGSLVRADSRARVTSARMIGDPVIDILPGTPAARMLRTGDTLRVERRPEGAQLVARARLVQLSLDTAVLEARALSGPLRARIAAYDRLQQRLVLAQREAAAFGAELRGSPALALLGSGRAQTSLGQAQAALTELANAFATLQQRAEAAGMESARSLGASVARLKQTIAALEAEMQLEGGTLDRMRRDSAVFRALAGARAELDSLIADAKRNPLRYVF